MDERAVWKGDGATRAAVLAPALRSLRDLTTGAEFGAADLDRLAASAGVALAALSGLEGEAPCVADLRAMEGDLRRWARDEGLSRHWSEAAPAAARAAHGEVGAALAEKARASAAEFRRVWPAPALQRLLDGLDAALGLEPRGGGPGARRLAAIDVGTNSIRLIVAEALPDGRYRILDDEKESARLGAGLAASGAMSDEAMERAATAIARMREIASGYGVSVVRLVGTAVCRDASNTPALAARIREKSGLELEVISSEQEARLAYTSVERAFDLSGMDAAVADIGGGSTEVVFSARGLVEQIHSMPIGAVRLMERFGGAEQAARRRYDDMIDWIKQEMEERLGRAPFAPQTLIGTGGTFTALATMSLHRRGEKTEDGTVAAAALRRHEMSRADVVHLLDSLRQMSLRERARMPGLSADRADIIVPGLAIIDCLMDHLQVNRLRVHDRGIRDGILLTTIDEMFPGERRNGAGAGDERHASVERFAASCDYDREHCGHVCGLALQVFDQIAAGALGGPPRADLSAGARSLLEAAALLHDVGYHINYAQHHQHSYHLISHADLAGYSGREQEVIANVARYHRKSEPKMKHPNFAKLDEDDRRLVRVLAAILRVADGLDRSHKRAVTRIDVSRQGERAVFAVHAAEDPEVDLWGAARKGELFQRMFGLEPTFDWAGRPSAQPVRAAV